MCLVHFRCLFFKHRGSDEQTTAPVAASVGAELHQLVTDDSVDDVELLKQIITELEREKAKVQNEVRVTVNYLLYFGTYLSFFNWS